MSSFPQVASFTEKFKTIPQAESEAESVLFCSDLFQSLRMNIVCVILILGIILVIATPSLVNVYKKSKLKSEEIFTSRLSEVIDMFNQ